MWTFIKWTHLLRTCNVDIYKVDTFSEDISVHTMPELALKAEKSSKSFDH